MSRWSRCVVLCGFALTVAACGRGSTPRRSVPEPAASGPVTLPIEVLADTGRSEEGLGAGTAIGARAWLARVSETPIEGRDHALSRPEGGAPPGPAPISPPSRGAIEAPLPDAAPDSVLPEWPSPPVLAVPAGLVPPVLRESAPLRIPRGRHAPASVEVELRVDETGAVSDVRWAGGSTDPALVAAAIECARSMRFVPARRGGEPVAVWCGQRFDFGAR